MTAFRIEYSIQRSIDDDEQEFEEIGFGSSGAWDDLEAAAHMVGTDIDNRQWETQPGMPDPETVTGDE